MNVLCKSFYFLSTKTILADSICSCNCYHHFIIAVAINLEKAPDTHKILDIFDTRIILKARSGGTFLLSHILGGKVGFSLRLKLSQFTQSPGPARVTHETIY